MKSIFLWASLAAWARAESLEAILARMDESAKKFKSVTAVMHQTEFTAVINEKTEEDARLALKKGREGGVRLRVDFSGPDARVIALNGHMVTEYLPKASQATDYDLSKYTSAATVDELLLLSFGSASSAELKKKYGMTAAGTEKIGEAATTRVELIPKSAELQKQVTRITLWIPEGRTAAVQEKVDQASKNYVLWKYSDVSTKEVPDSAVELKLPAGVKRITAK